MAKKPAVKNPQLNKATRCASAAQARRVKKRANRDNGMRDLYAIGTSCDIWLRKRGLPQEQFNPAFTQKEPPPATT